MSTEYYSVCEECLEHMVHYHRADEAPIARAFFNGKERVFVTYLTKRRDPATRILTEEGHLTTLAQAERNEDLRSTG